tara:strand:- start:1479 stop:1733 length:255 start_codon:yes stop_codon:yes gene_type:complete
MNPVLIVGGVFILIAFIALIYLIMKTRSSLNELEEKVDRNTGRSKDQRKVAEAHERTAEDLDTVWAKMEEVLAWIYAADPVLYA